MDARITKSRLSGMLSYDWLKIVGGSAAAIVVWALVFTMTATRITPAQQFTVFNYIGNVSLSSKFNASYSKLIDDGVFSYEVLETNINDLTTTGDYMNTVLEARFVTDEGDVMFISMENNPDTEYTDENGETKYESYYQGFLNSWFNYVQRLDGEDGYFAQMENYLNIFYTNGYQDGDSLDESKVESNFRAHIKATKDKRFKKESQIQQGLKDELARIRKYRQALLDFNSYIDAGYVEFTESTITLNYSETTLTYTGVYAINLCPNVETMGGLQEYVSYYTEYVDEDGNTQTKTTAEDMQLIFLDMSGVDAEFKYESLLYVNSVIEAYCSALNE